MSEKVPGEKPGPLTHYVIDGKEQSTTLEAMTPREILRDAGLDPQTHTLACIEDGGRRPCADPDQPIPLREHMEFVSSKS